MPATRCKGHTAHGQCERPAVFVVMVPNEKTQHSCRIHIAQVVKRWADDPVFAIITVRHLDAYGSPHSDA